MYVETYATADNLFYLMDVLDALRILEKTHTQSIALIYIDPPFDTGSSFFYRARIGEQGYAGNSTYTMELDAYQDNRSDYASLLFDVLRICHGLLTPTGSIYVHLDYRFSYKARIMLDEIFGEKQFMNEIIWSYKSGGRAKRFFSRKHDNILFYKKGAKHYFDIESVGTPRGKEHRNNMKRTVDAQGNVTMTIKSGGKVYTYSEESLIYPSDVWTDISHLQQKDPERTGYDTQKPEALLRRIILASSREGDIVADFFSGSGTTAKVAYSLNRRFLAVDSNPVSMQLLKKRILGVSKADTAQMGVCCICDNRLLKCANEATLRIQAQENTVTITLMTYARPPASQSLKKELCQLSGIEYVDSWGIGIVQNGTIVMKQWSARSIASPTLCLCLTANMQEAHDAAPLVAVIVDTYANQRIYAINKQQGTYSNYIG